QGPSLWRGAERGRAVAGERQRGWDRARVGGAEGTTARHVAAPRQRGPWGRALGRWTVAGQRQPGSDRAVVGRAEWTAHVHVAGPHQRCPARGAECGRAAVG